MIVDWQFVWKRLSSAFSLLTEEVRRVNGLAISEAGHTETETFPFGAYLTFSRDGTPGVEDLVVSADCRSTGEALDLSCDISTGDGEVLFEGPSAEIRQDLGDYPGSVALERWLAGVELFLRSKANEVTRQLAPGRSSE